MTIARHSGRLGFDTNSLLDRRFSEMPSADAFFRALGADPAFIKYRPITVGLRGALDVCKAKYKIFQNPTIFQLSDYLVELEGWLEEKRFQALVADPHSENILDGELDKYPALALVGLVQKSGVLDPELSDTLISIDSAFKVLGVLAAIGAKTELDQRDEHIEKLPGILKVLRLSITPSKELFLGEGVFDVDRSLMGANSILEAIVNIRALPTGQALDGKISTSLNSALVKLELLLPSEKNLKVEKGVDGQLDSIIKNTEGLKSLQFSKVSVQPALQNLLPFLHMDFDPAGTLEYETYPEEDELLQTIEYDFGPDDFLQVDQKKTAVTELEEYRHKKTYFSERAQGRLMRVQGFSPYTVEIFNDIERNWLRDFLYSRLEKNDEDALEAFFIALSICLSKSAHELSSVNIGQDIRSQKEFCRVVPAVLKAAKPKLGTESDFYTHSDIINIQFPEIMVKLFCRCGFFKSDQREKNYDFKSIGFDENKINELIISGVEKIRNKYGPRFIQKRIQSQLFYFLATRTGDIVLAQTLFRRSNEALAISGHYRFMKKNWVAKQYNQLAELYFNPGIENG